LIGRAIKCYYDLTAAPCEEGVSIAECSRGTLHCSEVLCVHVEWVLWSVSCKCRH